MALNDIQNFSEARAKANARFGIAQDGKPSDDQLGEQKLVQEAIASAGYVIERDIQDGREKALALTHLEEALMWAGKAIFK